METQAPIHASILVYLFAEQFSEPAKGQSTLGAIAPLTGNRVDAKKLVTNVYLSAIFELIDAGASRLETIEIDTLAGNEKILALSVINMPMKRISALAWQILRSIAMNGSAEQRRVREAVIQVIGGRASTYYAPLVALSWTMGEAEAFGYIQRPGKEADAQNLNFSAESLTHASVTFDRVNQIQKEFNASRAQWVAFEQSLGSDAVHLRREIAQGIHACEALVLNEGHAN